MWKACALVLAFATLSQAQSIPIDGNPADLTGCADDACLAQETSEAFNLENVHFEWEGYDGWYNNPAHPEWGGAGNICMCARGCKHDCSMCSFQKCVFLICKYL